MFKKVASQFNFYNDVKPTGGSQEVGTKRPVEKSHYGQFVEIDIDEQSQKSTKEKSKQQTLSTINLSDDLTKESPSSVGKEIKISNVPSFIATKYSNVSDISSLAPSLSSNSSDHWTDKITKEKSEMSLQFDMQL